MLLFVFFFFWGGGGGGEWIFFITWLHGSEAGDIFKYIFLYENVWISLQISLKFVPKFRISNILALVKVMACTDQATSHCLKQWWSNYWRIYASLGLNELTHFTCRFQETTWHDIFIIINIYIFIIYNCMAKLIFRKYIYVSQHSEFVVVHSRDKMAAIWQAMLPNAFSWMKMLEFRLTFH